MNATLLVISILFASLPLSAVDSQKSTPVVAQVRIPLKLRPHHTIDIRATNGELVHQTKPGEEMQFTLRGRINQTSHFYFAGYHVESVPVMWKKELREYGVRLQFYKTAGVDASIEDSIGSMNLQGHLVAEGDFVYKFLGHGDKTFTNPRGEPLLQASINSGLVENGAAIAKKEEALPPLASKIDSNEKKLELPTTLIPAEKVQP